MTGNRTRYATGISPVRSDRESCYGIQRFSAIRRKTRANQSTNHGGLASVIALLQSRRAAPLIAHFSNGAAALKIGPQYQIDGRSIVKKNLLFGIALVLLLGSIECHAERPSQRTDVIQAPNASVTHVSTRAGIEPSHLVDPPAAVAKLPNITCRRARPDLDPDCTSGHYLITVYPEGCSSSGFFGTAHPITGSLLNLRDSFPPGEATLIAKVRDKQFICISATAYGARGPEWYYVTAIPVSSVEPCTHSAACEDPGDLPIQWEVQPPASTCHLGSNDRYEGACPSGWVSSDEINQFSMGLR
jgi:hypothetical protein